VAENYGKLWSVDGTLKAAMHESGRLAIQPQPLQSCQLHATWAGVTVNTNAPTDGRCPIIGSPPQKVSPGRQFTGKNPPLPAAARARRIFASKLSAGGDFSGSDPIMRRLLWSRRYFNKGETYQFREHGDTFRSPIWTYNCRFQDYLSLGGFFMEKHFNVTPAVQSWMKKERVTDWEVCLLLRRQAGVVDWRAGERRLIGQQLHCVYLAMYEHSEAYTVATVWLSGRCGVGHHWGFIVQRGSAISGRTDGQTGLAWHTCWLGYLGYGLPTYLPSWWREEGEAACLYISVAAENIAAAVVARRALSLGIGSLRDSSTAAD